MIQIYGPLATARENTRISSTMNELTAAGSVGAAVPVRFTDLTLLIMI